VQEASLQRRYWSSLFWRDRGKKTRDGKTHTERGNGAGAAGFGGMGLRKNKRWKNTQKGGMVIFVPRVGIRGSLLEIRSMKCI